MNLTIVISNMLLISVLSTLFFLASKMEKWETLLSSSFECGFSSYFYSRFSFSIHYFLVGLIFLFLDLELCLLMPFMNENLSSIMSLNYMMMFVTILLMGLLLEWKDKKLDWNF